MFSQESDIVKTMRLIEELKAELIFDIGELYKDLAIGYGEIRQEILAKMIVNCYILGKRLGIDFVEMDENVKSTLKRRISDNNDLEKRFGDFSKLARHLDNKR